MGLKEKVKFATPGGNTFGKVFKSSEHALQWAKAMEHGRDDLAEMILNAPTAGAAKKIGDTITKSARWLEREAGLMLEILHEKIEQCYVFRQILISSSRRTLVEDTNNSVLGRGPDGIGENRLGLLLMQLCQMQMNGITLDSVFKSTRDAVPNLQSQIHFPSIQDANSLNINTRMVPPWK